MFILRALRAAKKVAEKNLTLAKLEIFLRWPIVKIFFENDVTQLNGYRVKVTGHFHANSAFYLYLIRFNRI